MAEEPKKNRAVGMLEFLDVVEWVRRLPDPLVGSYVLFAEKCSKDLDMQIGPSTMQKAFEGAKRKIVERTLRNQRAKRNNDKHAISGRVLSRIVERLEELFPGIRDEDMDRDIRILRNTYRGSVPNVTDDEDSAAR